MSGCAGVKAARTMKSSGAALMRRKGGKGGKNLMGKLGVEQNGRMLGCDRVLERRRSSVKEREADFW